MLESCLTDKDLVSLSLFLLLVPVAFGVAIFWIILLELEVIRCKKKSRK
jgi:hypothetical protein